MKKISVLFLILLTFSCKLKQDEEEFKANIVFTIGLENSSEIFVGDNIKYNNEHSRENIKQLTFNDFTDTFPRISPDKSKITFTSNRDLDTSIFMMNIDGSDQINLTPGFSNEKCSCFSPNGSKIAFLSDRDGSFEIYVMELSSKEIIRLTNNEIEETYIDWSSDGSKIVFSAIYPNERGKMILTGLGIIDYFTREETKIIDSNTMIGDFIAYSSIIYPRWSNDSKKIAFNASWGIGGNVYIFIINYIEELAIEKLPKLFESFYPIWSPDDTSILYKQDYNGATSIEYFYFSNENSSSYIQLSDQEIGFPDW